METFPKTPHKEPTFDLRAYWHILVKGKWAILASVIVVTAAVGFWTYRQPKIYRATTSLVIETAAPHVLNKVQEVYDSGSAGFWASKEFYETQYQILRSRDLAQRAVEKMGLDRDLDFLGLTGLTDKSKLSQALAAADPAGKLANMVMIAPVKDSKVVLVSFESPDPKRAARLANGLVEAYIDRNFEQRRSASVDAGTWLDERLGTLEKNLENSENQMIDFKKNKNLLSVSLEDQINLNSTKLRALAETLNRLEIQRLELDAKRKVIASLRTDTASAQVLERVLAGKEPLLTALKASEAKLMEQLVELRQKYGENNDKRTIPEAQLKEVQGQIQEEVKNALKALDAEYAQVRENEKAVNESFAREKRAAMEINELSVHYNRMKRMAENNQAMYSLVLGRSKETDLTSMLKTNNVRRLDPALVPKRPVRPRVQLNLGLAAAFGLALGIGLAFLLDLMDRTVKSQDDVETIVGLPFLGMIPSMEQQEHKPRRRGQPPELESVRTRDMYVLSHPRSPVAECHRSLRTNITFMSPEKPMRRLLVTSAGPREGKTTTAVGLGITMAQSGGRVVLVDTDMRRPRLHQALGVSNERGVTSLVVGECALADAIKGTDVPQLDVIPCGPVPPNPTELLHTERFKELLTRLSESYNLVILDSPPVIAVTDAMVLSTQVDGVVLVAKAGRTTKDMLSHTKRHLTGINANILGVVLNDVDVRRRQYGYYDYRDYGGRYGYYYADEKQDAAKA
jgi:polysaccharide biosynthesis transport protein